MRKPIKCVALSISLCLFLDSLTISAHESAVVEHQADKEVFFDANTAEVHKRRFMHSQFMLTAGQSEGRFSIVKEKFLPGFDSYSMSHAHHWHTEVFLMITGEMQWTVNGETQVLGPGDMVYIPPRAAHAAKVMGDEPVEAFMVYEPGGYEKNYFRRQALTPEQREDEALIKRMMADADVVPTKVEP